MDLAILVSDNEDYIITKDAAVVHTNERERKQEQQKVSDQVDTS